VTCPPFFGQLNEGNIAEIRTDRKPRANHRLFRSEKVVNTEWYSAA